MIGVRGLSVDAELDELFTGGDGMHRKCRMKSAECKVRFRREVAEGSHTGDPGPLSRSSCHESETADRAPFLSTGVDGEGALLSWS
jgi:hypothetical protein